jgi:hypothetical protein
MSGMDIGQSARKVGRGVRAALLGLRARAHETADKARASTGVGDRPETHHLPRWIKFAAVAVVALVLFYPLRAWWGETVDDDTTFGPAHVDSGQSAAAAVIAALIDREVNDHGWVVNSPGFTPTGMLLDDMPNFQRGLIAGVAPFGHIMESRIGRVGAVIDPDLAEAQADLAYPPDVWLWDWSRSMWPTGSSGGTYRDAMEALNRYNTRLAAHQAAFNASPANFAAVLDAVTADLDASANRIDAGVVGAGALSANEIFYRTKGSVYAEYLALEGFAKDFGAVLVTRNMMPAWLRMMADLKAAAEIRSGAVRTGAPGAVPQPCDLCTQGFFILRARLAMARLADAVRR